MNSTSEGTVEVRSEGDVITARRRIREVSSDMGFGVTDVTRIVTAVSELTRNVYLHAGGGTVSWRRIESGGREGIEVIFADEGPGIADIEQALTEGFTSGRGLGMGMSGAKRLMDDLELTSEPGSGTTVTVRKWLR